MTRFKGGFSVRVFTCLIIFTLCGRINGNEPVKVVVKEGRDAILPCSLSTKENIEFKLFVWRKDGQKEVFLYDAGLHSNNGHGGQDEQFKGRVSHFSDQLTNGIASIIIRNTKLSDSGSYTCDFPRLQPSQKFHIQLVVERVKVFVREDSDAILPCSLSTKEDIEFKLFDWRKDGQKEVFLFNAGLHSNSGHGGQDEQFEGRVSYFSDQLMKGDASIKIRNTKVSDSGSYTCDFPELQPSQTFHIELVVVEHVKVNEGRDAILPCSLSTKENIESKLFDWRKDGQTEVFFYNDGSHYNNGFSGQYEQFKGRVSHFQDELQHGNASIIIRNTKEADSGNYTCDFTALQPRQTFHIELVVVTPVTIIKVKIIQVPVKVNEGSDAILPCSLSTKENIESKLFDWRKDGQKEVFLYDGSFSHDNYTSNTQDPQFKGRIFHFRDELQHGNASIIIRNTKLSDSGEYTCDFPLLQPSQTFHIELVVDGILRDRRGENFPGAASEPSVTILDQTNDVVKLQCVIQGVSPKPEVEWKDSSGNIVPAEVPEIKERGDKYDIILEATVTKTDRYRCVVTQKEIYHQTGNDVDVTAGDPTGRIDSTGWIVATAVLVILLLVLVGAGVLFYKGIIRVGPIISCRRRENGSEIPPVSDHEQGNGLRTEPLLPGSDVPAQTSPV